MKRFIIVGLGIFGSTVAEALFAQRHEVVAVDPDEEAVDRIAQHVTRAAVGDGTQFRTLEQLGARNADVGVISTGQNITASILAMMAMRDLGVADVYVKVISQDHARVMEKLGVTGTIFPERESAFNFATQISSQNIVRYIRLAANLNIQEMTVPQAWRGRSLRELELRRHYSVSVIALHNVETEEVVPTPDPDLPLTQADALIIVGREEDLARCLQVA